MKNRAVVMPFARVGQVVLDRERRPVDVEFDHETAGIGHYIDPRVRGDHFRLVLLRVGYPRGQRGAQEKCK